jgi:hypothetical protein
MRHLAIVAALAISFAASASAQPKSISHDSGTEAIQLLQRKGIISGKTRVVRAEWSADAKCWLITVRRPSGTVSSWIVDSDAQNYQYVCKH